ncbi:MAG: hypothetical protein CL940_09020 [Deltaproteobacteria bacterium]|nr:hypothetical protein [Deltaproteobacteria bacterium]
MRSPQLVPAETNFESIPEDLSISAERSSAETALDVPVVPGSPALQRPKGIKASPLDTSTMRKRRKKAGENRAFRKTTQLRQYDAMDWQDTPRRVKEPEAEEKEAYAQFDEAPSLLTTGVKTPRNYQDAQRKALHLDEVERARAWAAMTIFLPVSCIFLLPFVEVPLGRALVYAVSLVYMIGVSMWVWSRTRNPADYTPKVFRIFGYSAVSVSFVVEYFLGVFSPTPLVVILGMSFYGTGRDRKHALGICLYAIIGYFLLLCLTATGAIEDVGMISAASSNVATRVTFVILCPLVMLATVYMARVTRSSTDDAMTRYHLAAARAKDNEAQLLEANRELEQALKLGAGQSGAFTGKRAGRFKLGPVIGQGGMGVVYAALDPATGDRAAVKVLKINSDEDPTDYQRFLREGRIASSLNLENVVRVYDCGQIERFEVPYIAMEHLRGIELARMLRRRSRLPSHEVVELAVHLSRGLDGAHSVGIVHRDLKPRNIFLCDATKQWKILDFGVCKRTSSKGTLTGINQLIGTPSYMSPEQARGEHVDHRSDIFALGSLLYRTTTGRPPFNGKDIASVVFEVAFRHPERPSGIIKSLHSDVDRVLSIALAKDRDERFDSAGELARAFMSAVEGDLDARLRARGDELLTQAAQPFQLR